MRSVRLALGVVPALMLAAIVLPMILHWGDLPNPMAVHWGFTGDPDGSLPPIALGLLLAGIFVAIWWAVRIAVSRDPREGGSFTAGLYFFGGLLVAVQWMSVFANRDVVEWQAADPIGWFQVVVVVAAGIGAGIVGWVLGGARSGEESHPRSEARVLPVDVPAGLMWSGRARGIVTTVGGLGVIVAGLAMWGWITLGLVAVGLIVLIFAEVRMTIGSDAAIVSLGWLGVPWRKIPVERITRADVEKVSPMTYGGWGYRGRPGVRAFVIRGGDGIRLQREGKPDLVVTVDDAETGAALINSLVRVG